MWVHTEYNNYYVITWSTEKLGNYISIVTIISEIISDCISNVSLYMTEYVGVYATEYTKIVYINSEWTESTLVYQWSETCNPYLQ